MDRETNWDVLIVRKGNQAMELKRILKKVERKYPSEYTKTVFYSDLSGYICKAGQQGVIFKFANIAELRAHLGLEKRKKDEVIIS